MPEYAKMSKAKRTRLFTNRNFIDPEAFEFIEMEVYSGRQYLYWRAGQRDIIVDNADTTYAVVYTGMAEACFPVCVEFVKELLQKHGREYKETGLEFAKTYVDLLCK